MVNGFEKGKRAEGAINGVRCQIILESSFGSNLCRFRFRVRLIRGVFVALKG